MARLRDLLNHKQSLVILGALAVVVVFAVAISLRTSAVDPRVTLEQGRVLSESEKEAVFVPGLASLSAAMNGEVARTADRRAEVTALAFSTGVYLGDAGLKGRLPPNVQTLLSGLIQAGLMPQGLAQTQSPGTLGSEWGTVSVRYRSAPLGVELVSIASKPEYGPALILRFPDEAADGGRVGLYVADKLDGVTVPSPFMSAAEVILRGWTLERLRSLK